MTTYDQDWEQFKEWLGINKRRLVSPPLVRVSNKERYMAISDLHIPFHNQEAIVYSVEKAKQERVSTVVIGGDIVDCYSLSRFSKFQNVPVKEEYLKARCVLDYLSRSFNRVVLLQGNHEERERKYFSNKLTPDEADWLLEKPMLARCVQDMPNVTLHKNIVHKTDLNWLIQLGEDVIIGHPEKSGASFAPVEKFKAWINTWGKSLGFNDSPRLVIAGHTHQAGVTFSGSTMLVESGCLCEFQDYALKPNLSPKPQRLAYTIFDMNNGKVSLSSLRQYYPFED